MTLPKPGEHITCRCGRCDDVTGHIVMLVLDGQIARVECRACGSVHKYRSATTAARTSGKPSASLVRAGQSRKEAMEPKAGSKARSAPATRKDSRAISKNKAKNAWQEAMMRHSDETPLAYAMNKSYAPNSFIEHHVFGRGEVIAVIPPDKMDILFEEGVKTLRCKVSAD